MSITIYTDVIVPNALLSAGARGRIVRNNTRVQTSNGRQTINVNWARSLRQFELGFVPMTVDQWASAQALFEATEGGATGMLMADPSDQSVKITEGVATLVSGTVYQLHKRYTAAGSSRTKDRKITRPIASGFDIKVSGVSLTQGTQYTLDDTTGKVTIPSTPTAADITWSGNFYVPVHFENDQIDWELVRSGPAETRLFSGPSLTLKEVME